MNKKSLILFVLLNLVLISIFSVTAITTDLQSNYSPGQTLITKFSGNFLDSIKAESIYFYSGRDFIAMPYDVGKIENDFYIYSVLPIQERNYTLIIKNVKSLELGKETTRDLYYNFSVIGNVSDFSVNPGFIITTSNFSIKITSNINPIKVQTTFLNVSQEINVNPISSETAKFSISSIKKSGLNYLILKYSNQSYSIPVYVFKQPVNISAPSIKLEFSKSKLNYTILKNQDFEFKVYLSNPGQEDLENITVISDLDIIKIYPNRINELISGDSVKINLTIKSKEDGYEEGELTAKTSNYSTHIPVFITTSSNITYVQQVTKNNTDILQEETCEQLNGKVCESGTICEEDGTQLTADGKICCLKECKTISSFGTGKLIALIVIIVVLAGIGYVLFRRSRLKRINPKEIIKKTAKDFEERFKPQETRGDITRI